MKTLKIAVIGVFVAFAALSASSNGRFDILPKQVVHMTIEKAMQYPELVQEMYKQLNADMLNTNGLTFIGVVEYHNTVCYISGTYAQWQWFFSHQGIKLSEKKISKPKAN